MPPYRVEIQVIIRIGVVLREAGDALHRYAESAEAEARPDAPLRGFAPGDLAELTAAWNRIGQALQGVQGAAPPPAGPRPHLTEIENSLTTIRDIFRKQIS